MKTIFAAILIAVGSAPSAIAQPAMALGHPLPSAQLETGTVSVRVIAGSASNNVSGADVTLVVNGAPRQARSDDTGHAKFPGLTVGATVQAKIKDADGKEVASDQFAVPGAGGVTVMLTTKPFAGGGMPGGGAAAAQGPMAGGGMPQPRQLSGEPRPEPNDPSGTITVRLSYNDFSAPAPVGVPVTLVAYSWDDKIAVVTHPSDKDGRAVFGNLDRTGGTAYFAMAQLPRNGGMDRLFSVPVELASNAGVRMVLSAEKRDSTAPPVDDLTKLEKQPKVPSGKVVVALAGVPTVGDVVKLVDAATGKPIAEAKAAAAAPDPSHIQGESQFEPLPNAQLGTLAILVHGGPGAKDEPIDDVTISVVVEGQPTPSTAKTAGGGNAMFMLKPGAKGTATITVNGKDIASKPWELPAAGGGGVEFVAHWEAQGQIQAVIDAPFVAGQVVYAETTMHHQTNRSLPFQLLESSGSHATVYILPRIMATYRLGAEIEDKLLGVQGRFTLSNNAWAPYRGGPDGIVLPGPKGFRGGVVAEMDQADVAVAPDEGFRIVRPLAPGQKQFHAGFSLPVEGGQVKWKLDLPFGAFESGIQIKPEPGMEIMPPGGVAIDLRHVKDGTPCATIDDGTPENACMYVMDHMSTQDAAGMTLMPNTQLMLRIDGLPAAPAWSLWMPRVLGIVVVGTMLGGLAFALRRKSGEPGHHARKEELMAELVELEREGKHGARRDAILTELEGLWTDE